MTVASEAKHSASPSASRAFSDDMKSSIAFGKCTDMVILLLSARIRRLRIGWSSAYKWQERTTNFAGQTDLPAIGKSNPCIWAAANQPDGQITSGFQKSCQAPKSK